MDVITEARTKKEAIADDKVAVGGKVVDNDKYTLDKLDNKDAEKNASKGAFGVNEPVDDTVMDQDDFDQETIDDNTEALLDKFLAEEDFFILGRAGWGKTSMVESMAKRMGYEVVTFYLDKCQASDLGGIPVPMEMQDKNGKKGVRDERALPPFAQIIHDNPDKKFLLFFDEMNQAAPDVMNALMPIILKKTICGRQYDNFFVGAAGNFESENQAVNELSGPLRSRLTPIIVWKTDDDQSWKTACKYLHKKWDKKIGEDLMDKICDNCKLFVNPRELDMKVIQWAYTLNQSTNKAKSAIRPTKIAGRLRDLSKKDLQRSENDKLDKMADMLYAFINNKIGETAEKKVGRSSKKTMQMIPEDIVAALKMAAEAGFMYINGDKTNKYGISEENIGKLMDPELYNAEMVQRMLDQFKTDGVKFKFKTDAEWKKLPGYTDPLA